MLAKLLTAFPVFCADIPLIQTCDKSIHAKALMLTQHLTETA